MKMLDVDTQLFFGNTRPRGPLARGWIQRTEVVCNDPYPQACGKVSKLQRR